MLRLVGILAFLLPMRTEGMRMKESQKSSALTFGSLHAREVSELRANGTTVDMASILGRNPPERHWDDNKFRPPDINPNWDLGKVQERWSHGRENMLVPDLVAPPGSWYQFRVKEKPRIVETNEYEWELDMANGLDLGWRIAKLEGKWTSSQFGHQSVHVHNHAGREIFKIRNDKYVWNPFSRRWSYRILPPHSKDSADAWFTINKDAWGRGLLFLRDEWRIYRGRERDNDMVYYCVGSYFGWNWWFYRNKHAYDNGEEAIAEISQKWNAGAFLGGGGGMGEDFGAGLGTWLPDKFKLRIKDGEDSALLMSVATIIDMVYDSEERTRASNRDDDHHDHD